jgi:hypothetical protein
MLRKYRFGKKEATALCFCAAAKGLVVGTPVLDILYGGFEPERKAIISIPMVLYQGTCCPGPSSHWLMLSQASKSS